MAVGVAPNGSPASHTLIVSSTEPETIVLPSGAKAMEVIGRLWAFSLLALSSRVPEKHAERASEVREWQLAKAETAAPASQTLIVLSQEPETIVLPSGSKATEVMRSLCAFSLLALSSRVPANEGRRV